MSRARELEILVAKIQQGLAPNATVEHDVRLPGRHSGRSRQIDVLVRDRIGQFDLVVVIECKDHARPVDVKGVEEFLGLVQDVGAHRGAMVCPKGFSQAAKTRAAGLQLDLYSPVDTEPHAWQVKATVPALCDYRAAAVSFGVRCSTPKPFQMPWDFYNLDVLDEEMNSLGSLMSIFQSQWNSGKLPIEPGIHRDLSLFETPVYVDNGYNDTVQVELPVSIMVDRELFFGQLPIEKVSGFRDEQTGLVITNGFEFGLVTPDEVENHWQKIAEEAEAPVSPFIAFRGLIAIGE